MPMGKPPETKLVPAAKLEPERWHLADTGRAPWGEGLLGRRFGRNGALSDHDRSRWAPAPPACRIYRHAREYYRK